jgi:hypothetical protein
LHRSAARLACLEAYFYCRNIVPTSSLCFLDHTRDNNIDIIIAAIPAVSTTAAASKLFFHLPSANQVRRIHPVRPTSSQRSCGVGVSFSLTFGSAIFPLRSKGPAERRPEVANASFILQRAKKTFRGRSTRRLAASKLSRRRVIVTSRLSAGLPSRERSGR